MTTGWQFLIRDLLFRLVSRSKPVTGRLGKIREKEAESYRQTKVAGGARVIVLQFDKARAAQLRLRPELL
jgi:hypothetical protein